MLDINIYWDSLKSAQKIVHTKRLKSVFAATFVLFTKNQFDEA